MTLGAGRAARRRLGRGVVQAYAMFAFVALLAVVSLAVDFGRVQLVKTQLQTCADATALAAASAYAETHDVTYATNAATAVFAGDKDLDGLAGDPVVTMTAGTWNQTSRTFSSTYAPGLSAVQITVARTAANGNAVPLVFGKMVGKSTCDVRATAVAITVVDDAASTTVSATGSLYLAGLPAGGSTAFGDTTYNANPNQVTAIDVVPGTWVSFTNTSGSCSILPGTTPYVNANGESTRPLHHGQNQDGANWGIGPENGIADAIIPGAALTGIFVTDTSPATLTAPTRVRDWGNASLANQASYTDLQTREPFLIGTGATTGGQTKQFLVPPGATKLYLGVWDGVANYNNGGSFSTTVRLSHTSMLVW
jgi:hypothetical protein